MAHSCWWKELTLVVLGALLSTFVDETLALSFHKDTSLSFKSGLSLCQLGSSFTLSNSVSRLCCDNDFASSTSSTRSSYWLMGKGDGKKKRTTKKSPNVPITPNPVNPPPQRVSTEINIPVRHQIMWGKMKKEAAKDAGQSFRQKKVTRTSYRRTWDEEEIELKREERARKGKEPDWDVILNQTTSRPLVIVDGYNIIHKWPRLKKHMVKNDLSRARQLLVDDLESLRALKGWRIEVVFDGAGKSSIGPLGHGPGGLSVINADRSTSKEVTKHGVRLVFTGAGVEADSYIEKRCIEAKNSTKGELTRSFIIATDDSMIRLAGQNAGAMCMSADRFLEELKSIKKATQYRVEAAMAKVNGQPMRAEKLMGSHLLVTSFGRNSILIEDKRNRTKARRRNDIELLPEDYVNVTVIEDEYGIPWWAKVPNRTRIR